MFPHVPKPGAVAFGQIVAMEHKENYFIIDFSDFQTSVSDDIVAENVNGGIGGIFFRQNAVFELAVGCGSSNKQQKGVSLETERRPLFYFFDA